MNKTESTKANVKKVSGITPSCSFCQKSEEYKKYLVKKFTYWRVELWTNQCYLGRCVVILNRHAEDLFEITNKEQAELFAIVPRLQAVLKKHFEPDLFNYESLGNKVRHLHVRITPRYKKSVSFEGHIFTDERWGKNPSPYNTKFQTPNTVIQKLCKLFSTNLTTQNVSK